jgi:hypothetical protein
MMVVYICNHDYDHPPKTSPFEARYMNASISYPEYGARRLQLYWLDPTKFRLEETSALRAGSSGPTLAPILGHFGREPPEQNPAWPVVEFSAEAVCELIPGGKYQIVEFRPGDFRFVD